MPDSTDWHRRMLRAWQLALLRFAVTLDHADRLHVMAIANEIDRGGHQRDEQAFSFFRRTSGDLCSSLLHQNEAAATILRRFLISIEDPRLKRAFVAALEIDPGPKIRKATADNGLWRGLASARS